MDTNKHQNAEKQDDKTAKSNKHNRYRPAQSIDEVIMLNYPALYMFAEHIKKVSSADVAK